MTRSKYRDAAEANAAHKAQNRAWQQIHRVRYPSPGRAFCAEPRLDPPSREPPAPRIPPVHQCIRTVQPPTLGSIAFALLYGR